MIIEFKKIIYSILISFLFILVFICVSGCSVDDYDYYDGAKKMMEKHDNIMHEIDDDVYTDEQYQTECIDALLELEKLKDEYNNRSIKCLKINNPNTEQQIFNISYEMVSLKIDGYKELIKYLEKDNTDSNLKISYKKKFKRFSELKDKRSKLIKELIPKKQ